MMRSAYGFWLSSPMWREKKVAMLHFPEGTDFNSVIDVVARAKGATLLKRVPKLPPGFLLEVPGDPFFHPVVGPAIGPRRKVS